MTSNALALAQKVSILASSSGASTTTYANPTDLPTAEVTTGAMAYVSASNKLYMWNGTAWFNIAIVNQAPTAITGNQATYFLSKDGTPTVVTLVSTDPEGLPLTWSSSTSGDTQVGTVTNTDNVFTITPSTDEADIGTLSVTFSVTDGNNTETSVSSFTLEFLSPYWNETVLSIGTSSTNGLANNTFIDRSTNAHTVTPAGTSVQTAFHPYLENWGVEFDGSGDYLSVPSSTDFAFGTGDFTVEFWYYRTATPSTTDGLVSWNYLSGVHIAENTAGIFLWVGGTQIFQPSTKTVLNSWNHVAVSRSGSTVKLFVNGAEVDSASSSQSVTANTLYIGASSHATSEAANGYISNVRLLKGTALYTTNFTPPTEKLTAVTGTSLLTCQSNRFVDNSSNAHTITPTGNVKVSAFNPFGQESEYAAGENKGSSFISPNNYLNIADPTNNFHLNNQEFALEFWVYLTPDNAAGSLVSKWTSGYSGYRINCNADGTIGFYNVTTSYFVTTKVTLNAWNHYACTRDSNGILRQFINGVLQRSDTVNPSNASGSVSMLVGTLHIYPTQGLNEGYISDFRLVKGAPIYTTNFTPPTAPVGNTNASLYLPMDNAGIFDKTGNNTLTPIGNASTSTTQTKYADTAMYFDGSGDYIRDNSPSEGLVLGTGDFTIELWTNLSAYTQYGHFVNVYNGTPQTGAWFLRMNNTNQSWQWQNGANGGASGFAALNSSSNLSLNTWHHLAVVKNSGTVTSYQDGISVGSYSDTQSFVADRLSIGADGTGGYPLNGYIENLQILKGVAKYTANFTPPNRTQGITYQEES